MGDLTHVGAALQLRLQFAHQGSHCRHTLGVNARQCAINHRVDFLSGELSGKKGLDDGNFGVFLFGQFRALCIPVLLGGVATLLDHFVHDGQGAVVVDLDPLVDFDSFELGLN